jgi:hypothetical protein
MEFGVVEFWSNGIDEFKHYSIIPIVGVFVTGICYSLTKEQEFNRRFCKVLILMGIYFLKSK